MLDKMKSMMGFNVQPNYTIYYECTTIACSYIDSDGWYKDGHIENECQSPGGCSAYACDYNC